MNNQARVSEIYTTAGNVFKLLGELTSQLESAEDSTRTSSGSRWTDREIEMLEKAVGNFAAQLHQISEEIKARAIDQVLTIFIKAISAKTVTVKLGYKKLSGTGRKWFVITVKKSYKKCH